jgi:hypothetical protein
LLLQFRAQSQTRCSCRPSLHRKTPFNPL